MEALALACCSVQPIVAQYCIKEKIKGIAAYKVRTGDMVVGKRRLYQHASTFRVFLFVQNFPATTSQLQDPFSYNDTRILCKN
ncbi:hypothetical protein VNO77_01921 [Canavalia gladiata]|uniref:Uncharacterized protein n=1 Tax=Canavalia gladiata TaxID=3824 RepID=A0AAN9MSP4_CANGL